MELILLDRLDSEDMELVAQLNALALREKEPTEVVVFREVDRFIAHLRTFTDRKRIAVVLGGNTDLLTTLGDDLSALEGIELVLVLRDHDRITVKAGHRLHPRFLTFQDDSRRVLLGVISGMLEQGPGVSGN